MSADASAEGTVPIDDVMLHYRIDGRAGAPWLVFSNSLMTNLSLWDAQVAALSATHRILRYDQRGHGGSTIPPGPCTFPRLAADLAHLMDYLEIRAASVIGVSMGGVTALGLAATHPDKVERVAACDCGVRSTPEGNAAWDDRIAAAESGGMAALVEPTVRRWFTQPTFDRRDPALDRVRAMIASTPVDGFVRAARALQAYDFGAYPAALRCPALFLAGEADPPLPGLRAMAAAAAGGHFVSIAGAGHLPNVEQPEAFNAALLAFLEPHTSRGN